MNRIAPWPLDHFVIIYWVPPLQEAHTDHVR